MSHLEQQSLEIKYNLNFLCLSYTLVFVRTAGVVGGIGLTIDVEWRRRKIKCGSPMVPFLKIGMPSTKSGKTNGVLVEGDIARRLRTVFSTFAKILRLLKKIFSNLDKIEDAKNLHTL
jgi:hypothetical protein